MSTITVDQARKMGADRVPLRLTAKRRTLVLNKQDSDDGIVATVETGRGASAVPVATLFADWPTRPSIFDAHIYYRGAYLSLTDGESALVAAWLEGYYAPAGGAK